MGTAKWSDLNYEVAIFKTFEEIKLVENKAAAVAEFLKKDKAAFDIQNKFGRYRIEIEEKKGKWLDENFPHGVNAKYRNSGVTQMETPELTDENSESITVENADLEVEMPVSPKESSNARLINNEPDLREKVINELIQKGKVITPKLVSTGIRKILKGTTLEDKKAEFIKQSKNDIFILPEVCLMDCNDFMNTFDDDSIDLLFTDPPYSTDVPNIAEFTKKWLEIAIKKTKKTGRMLIFAGAYPEEVQAFLNVLLSQDKFIVDCPLIWTFKNTLGVTPKMYYNLNYQFIWHLYSKDSPELDTSITNEMFSVMEVNAPDARLGNKVHTWQKPDDLALRLIRHTTKVNDLIVDPFACTGSFILAANRLLRTGKGCDNSQENLNIAISRGCQLMRI